MHEDPGAASEIPPDPFARKTMPLPAETSTWASSAERTGMEPYSPNQQVPGQGQQWGEGSVLTFRGKLMERGAKGDHRMYEDT